MSVTYRQIIEAIRTVLTTADIADKVEALDTLTEGVNDTPMIRVIPQKGGMTRTAFGNAGQKTDFTVILDGYARQRSHLDEDTVAQIGLVDAISTVLEGQTKPYFGVSGCQGLDWSWELTTFQVGSADKLVLYAGVRYTVELTLF